MIAVRLHAASRQFPRALALLAVIAVAMRAVEPWTQGSGEFPRLLPILLTVAAAAVVASCTASPFDEVERTACRLPLLRLILVSVLVVAATVALTLARPTDGGALVRNLVGLTGLALLTARVLGGALAWTVPLAYAVLCGGAIDLRDESLWTWPTLPADDGTALLLALLVFGAGLATAVAHGARDEPPHPEPR